MMKLKKNIVLTSISAVLISTYISYKNNNKRELPKFASTETKLLIPSNTEESLKEDKKLFPSINPSNTPTPVPTQTTFPTIKSNLFENINKRTWIKPVEGKIPNPFGNNYPFYGYYRAGHTGIDILAKVGTPVKAVDEGIVRYTKLTNNMRYGKYVVIEHPNHLFTLYGHLKDVLVKVNKKVKQADIIGHTGVTGLASFPHIHFEVTDRTPIRDGAYGYNYICPNRKTSLTHKTMLIEKKLENSKPKVLDLMPLEKVIENFAFLEQPKKEMNSFYRMKAGHCIELRIPQITYYNPEEFLPKFEKTEMLKFAYKPKSKKVTPKINK